MRSTALALIVFAALTAACGTDPVRAPRGDGVLVLEVGGDQPSLRASLLAAGRSVEPPRWLQPRPELAAPPVAPPASQLDPSVAREPVPQVNSTNRSEPPVERIDPPKPEPEWITVPLPKGETLIHVARRHLGDGRRYVDLLEWNGWNDADARRLKQDAPVRIKRSEMRTPR